MRGPTGYVTAAVGLVNDYPGTDVVVDSNFLEGASGADLEGGATPGKACSPGCYFDHITVRNNAFSPDNQSGTAQAVNLDTGAPGFTWADNIDSEIGAVLARP
jgi:hypothetical protein